MNPPKDLTQYLDRVHVAMDKLDVKSRMRVIEKTADVLEKERLTLMDRWDREWENLKKDEQAKALAGEYKNPSTGGERYVT